MPICAPSSAVHCFRFSIHTKNVEPVLCLETSVGLKSLRLLPLGIVQTLRDLLSALGLSKTFRKRLCMYVSHPPVITQRAIADRWSSVPRGFQHSERTLQRYKISTNYNIFYTKITISTSLVNAFSLEPPSNESKNHRKGELLTVFTKKRSEKSENIWKIREKCLPLHRQK